MKNPKLSVPAERIEQAILLIRGQKVMLDRDLAKLYGVTTGNLNKAVNRNLDRFPDDFMFQLTPDEYNSLRFQFGILKKGQHVFDILQQTSAIICENPCPIKIGFQVKESSATYGRKRKQSTRRPRTTT